MPRIGGAMRDREGRERMKVITVAAPKGGSGKTTITSALAVRACEDSGDIVLIDLNADQGDLTNWWINRGEPENPWLYGELSLITRDIARLARSGFEWCLIDTPPGNLDLIEAAVAVADAVLIPVRASFFDITAIDAVVEMCKQRKKRFAFVLSAVDSKFKALNNTAHAALVEDGPVLSARTSYRLSYINAVTIGKTGPEVDASLKPEIDTLWSEVKRLAGGADVVEGAHVR